MPSKFQSPAQDYVAHRISLDDVCNIQRNSVYLIRAEGGAIMAGIHPDAILVLDVRPLRYMAALFLHPWGKSW